MSHRIQRNDNAGINNGGNFQIIFHLFFYIFNVQSLKVFIRFDYVAAAELFVLIAICGTIGHQSFSICWLSLMRFLFVWNYFSDVK